MVEAFSDTDGEAMVENGVIIEDDMTCVVCIAATEFVEATAGLTVRDQSVFRGKRGSNMVGVA